MRVKIKKAHDIFKNVMTLFDIELNVSQTLFT